jgi:homoserine O-acetyltransferase
MSMRHELRSCLVALLLLPMLSPGSPAQQAATSTAPVPSPREADYVARNFHFRSGESLPELRLHYRTLGAPAHDARGRVTNAVLLLHATGGSGTQFLQPQFADVLLGPGQLLDTNRYFVVLPDAIGHGNSSKPSDGLRARFPQYDYADMVASQHQLLTEALGVDHLRLVLGTSMGCMHAWLWAETYPTSMDAVMALACLPVEVSGRNQMWRQMTIDGIRQDPEWKNGDYTTQPRAALQLWADITLIAFNGTLQLQAAAPTRAAANQYVADHMKQVAPTFEANNALYALNASRSYDPSSRLETISTAVMLVNSADDFINPPELGIAQREITRVKRGRFALVPASAQTHGHFTFAWPVFWQQHLRRLLAESAPRGAGGTATLPH